MGAVQVGEAVAGVVVRASSVWTLRVSGRGGYRDGYSASDGWGKCHRVNGKCGAW